MTFRAPQNDRDDRLRKRRVYQEEAKTRQTSHWDWDYLPHETLVRLARNDRAVQGHEQRTRAPNRKQGLGFICIGAGVLIMTALFVLIFLFQPQSV